MNADSIGALLASVTSATADGIVWPKPGSHSMRPRCPKCRRVQYWTCSNPACVCVLSVPPGKRAQVDLGHDAFACPYCGFAAHLDYWMEREELARAVRRRA